MYPSKFWRLLKSPQERPQVDLQTFTEHFKKLFAPKSDEQATSSMETNWKTNSSITVTKDDIGKALRRLKSGKSTGNCPYAIEAFKQHKHRGMQEALAVVVQSCLRSDMPTQLNAMLYMPLYKSRGCL